ncbi:MAG: hypothetical protein HYS22_07580 [Deltaproteobacteria bacterium]|nr:hypothetical protein [Deltaproteobacteria bacterium]
MATAAEITGRLRGTMADGYLSQPEWSSFKEGIKTSWSDGGREGLNDFIGEVAGQPHWVVDPAILEKWNKGTGQGIDSDPVRVIQGRQEQALRIKGLLEEKVGDKVLSEADWDGLKSQIGSVWDKGGLAGIILFLADNGDRWTIEGSLKTRIEEKLVSKGFVQASLLGGIKVHEEAAPPAAPAPPPAPADGGYDFEVLDLSDDRAPAEPAPPATSRMRGGDPEPPPAPPSPAAGRPVRGTTACSEAVKGRVNDALSPLLGPHGSLKDIKAKSQFQLLHGKIDIEFHIPEAESDGTMSIEVDVSQLKGPQDHTSFGEAVLGKLRATAKLTSVGTPAGEGTCFYKVPVPVEGSTSGY